MQPLNRFWSTVILGLIWTNLLWGQKILIPMDLLQTDHLKAYGSVYWTLKKGVPVEWLLNYRGGSFLLNNFSGLTQELRLRGVRYEEISTQPKPSRFTA